MLIIKLATKFINKKSARVYARYNNYLTFLYLLVTRVLASHVGKRLALQCSITKLLALKLGNYTYVV